jgi:hypothetical protein
MRGLRLLFGFAAFGGKRLVKATMWKLEEAVE